MKNEVILENPVIQTILSRRSVRNFTSQRIEPEKLDAIMKAAIHAPSGKNLQTWRFTVLRDPIKIQRLKETIIHVLKRTDGPPMYGFNSPDTVILVSNRKSNYNAYVDSACAIENMLIAAHALGLGGCWINALRTIYDEPEIRSLLTEYVIPDNHLIVGMIVLGYPSEMHKKTVKRESVIHYV